MATAPLPPVDPYRSPEAPVEAASTRLAAVRRVEGQLRALGRVAQGTGVVATLGVLGLVGLLHGVGEPFEAVPVGWVVAVLASPPVAVALLGTIVAGMGRGARLATLLLAVLAVAVLPLGPFLAAYLLRQRLSADGRAVFSAECVAHRRQHGPPPSSRGWVVVWAAAVAVAAAIGGVFGAGLLFGLAPLETVPLAL